MSKPDFDYWWFLEGRELMPDGVNDENEPTYKKLASAAFEYASIETTKDFKGNSSDEYDATKKRD